MFYLKTDSFFSEPSKEGSLIYGANMVWRLTENEKNFKFFY